MPFCISMAAELRFLFTQNLSPREVRTIYIVYTMVRAWIKFQIYSGYVVLKNGNMSHALCTLCCSLVHELLFAWFALITKYRFQEESQFSKAFDTRKKIPSKTSKEFINTIAKCNIHLTRKIFLFWYHVKIFYTRSKRKWIL